MDISPAALAARALRTRALVVGPATAGHREGCRPSGRPAADGRVAPHPHAL